MLPVWPADLPTSMRRRSDCAIEDGAPSCRQGGMLDANDGCPAQPEDTDGFEDEDGCPDPDNDRDGILDGNDGCPGQPETVNGFEDADGCPDVVPVPVAEVVQVEVVRCEEIQMHESVFFDTDRAEIQVRSLPLMDQVFAVLNANPDITLIRVEGHTDSSGSDSYNQETRKPGNQETRRIRRSRARTGREKTLGHGLRARISPKPGTRTFGIGVTVIAKYRV